MKLADLKKLLGLAAKEEDTKVEFKESSELTEFVSAFEAKENELTAALSEVEALKTELKNFAEAKAQAEAQAKKVKMDARMASLSKEVGDERAQKVLAATEAMDDAQFSAIAEALKMSADTEAKTALFNEAGVNDETTGNRVEESEEMKILKAKYK